MSLKESNTSDRYQLFCILDSVALMAAKSSSKADILAAVSQLIMASISRVVESPSQEPNFPNIKNVRLIISLRLPSPNEREDGHNVEGKGYLLCRGDPRGTGRFRRR